MAYQTYKVKRGDNYPKISSQLNVPTAQLIQANRQAPLSTGMTIRVPVTKGGRIGVGPLYVPPMQPGMDLQNPYNPTQPVQQVTQPTYRPPTLPVNASGNFILPPQGIFGTPSTPYQTTGNGTGGRGTMLPTAAGAQAAFGTVAPAPAPTQPVFPGFGGFRNPRGGSDIFFKTLWEAKAYSRRRIITQNEQDAKRKPADTVNNAQGTTQSVTWRVG